MGPLVAIGAVIVSAVATTAAVVATVISTVVAAVAAVAVAIGTAVAAIVTTIVTTTVAALSYAIGGVYSAISAGISYVLPTLTNVYSGIVTFTKTLVGGIKLFLEAIHFKVLLKVHELAMIFSKDYRDMMQKVYGEISKVSDALGFGAHFVNLVLQDARNVVLDVSSLMGRSYDMAQVTWLTTMNDYLKNFANVAETYAKKPGLLLEDIAEMIDKPAIDAKADYMRTLLTFLDNTITATDDTAKKIVQLRKDVEILVKDLPKQIQAPIWAKVNPFIEKIDVFFKDEYYPRSEQLNKAILILRDEGQQRSSRLHDIVQQILNPGDLLSNIDQLPELERRRQEDKIGEISQRGTRREIEQVNKSIDDAYKGMEKIFEAITERRELPEYHVPEYEGPVTPAGIAPIPRKTWFVGDF